MSDALISYQENLPEAADSLDSLLAAAFSHLETRGRGWDLSDHPVELEPMLCPLFLLLSAPEKPVTDDGRTHTFWSNLFGGAKDAGNNAALMTYRQELAEYKELLTRAHQSEFCDYYGAEFIELQLILPKEFKITKTIAENLLLSFSYLSFPVGFEVIGSSSEIIVQFVCTESDAERVKQQLRAHLPECRFREIRDYLLNHWINADEESVMIVDFGLSNDCFLPLKMSSSLEADFLVTVIGALENLRDGEIGVFQVLFSKCKQNWTDEIIQSVAYLEETGDYPKSWGRLRAAKEKTASQLFAASVRAASRSSDNTRTWAVVKAIGAGIASFAAPSGNELMPLSNDGFAPEYHEQSLIDRHTYRSGMLLSLEEIAAMVHPPSPQIRSAKLLRETTNTKSAPNLAIGHPLVLGDNFHENESRQVSLSNEQRTRHIHVLGASGGGKSSLLLNLIKQDLESGEGLCVIDPHGDLIDAIVAHVPESRVKDVVLFDPADAEFPIGFNILSANSELEKTLLASDLVATFRRMSTSWGDVMDSVLANAILAFVESGKGGTLFDLKRFLVEKEFRNEFLKTVSDEAIRYFWQHEFPLISGKPQSSILIRLDSFLRQKLIRNIVCQKNNKIDFRSVMDGRKILLVKLSQGLIGEENSALLGTLLVSKLYQAAMSRQDSENRPFFSCYLDEFHHFITPSMEGILSGARKYNLALVLAHQEFRQLHSRSQEVASSVLSNCYTRICFRLGDTDAEKFASGFSFFDGAALQNLGIGEAIGRIERAEYDFNLKTALPSKIEKSIAERRRAAVLEHSRNMYARTKTEVEELFYKARPIEKPKTVLEPQEKTVKPNSAPKDTAAAKPKDSAKQSIAAIPDAKTLAALDSATDSLPVQPTASGKETQGHRYLQSLVKKIAEASGFLATVEKEVLGGAGRIDVALENGELKIACEISVTNEADYEVQNIRKCLAAGYNSVIVISAHGRHLEKIKKLAAEHLVADEFAAAEFFTPEAFHHWLESLETIPAHKQANKVKGFKVNVKLKPVDETDLSTRKRAISEVVFAGLKKLKNKFKDG